MTNVVEPGGAMEDQARQWLIRMDADEPLSDAERVALQEWMSRSPLHRQELRRLARFWRQANILTELLVEPDAPAADSERNTIPPDRGPENGTPGERGARNT